MVLICLFSFRISSAWIAMSVAWPCTYRSIQRNNLLTFSHPTHLTWTWSMACTLPWRPPKAGGSWHGHWAVNASCLLFLLPKASCPCWLPGQHTKWRWDLRCTAWCHRWPSLPSPHRLWGESVYVDEVKSSWNPKIWTNKTKTLKENLAIGYLMH